MSRGSSSRAPTRTPEARAGGPTNLDEFVNGPEYGPEGDQEDVDVESGRDPKRRKLIHHASRRVTGKAAPDQELIDEPIASGQNRFGQLPTKQDGDQKTVGHQS